MISGQVTNVTEKIAPSIISFLLGRLYEKISGNSYSELSRKHLLILKEVYTEQFGQSNYPAFWALDDSYRPTSFIQDDELKLSVTNVSDSAKRNYPHQTRMISQNIIAYLVKRKNRWLGGGNPGDLLEQFLREWLQWSAKTLPTMAYDSDAIIILNNRLKYIEAVMRNVHLFNYGRFTRTPNKYDCFKTIKSNISKCLSLAKQEKMRTDATQMFDVMRTNMAELLHESVNVIYYARKTDVSALPLNILEYVTDSANPIKQSCSGQMLNELIYKAGIAAFTLEETSLKLGIEDYYFDGDNKVIAIVSKNHDFPIWVTTPAQKQEVFSAIHQLGAAILRYAEVKKLMEKARDLAAKSGNVWAYADENGKRSIENLKFLHNSALKNLQSLILQFIRQQNALLSDRMDTLRNKEQNSSTANHEYIENAEKNINALSKKLFTKMADISEQLSEYDGKSLLEINDMKLDLYRHINQTLQRNHPAQAKDRKLDETIVQCAPNTEAFEFPLKTCDSNRLSYEKESLKRFTFKNSPSIITNTWRVGMSYTDWTTYFFSHNKTFFSDYAELVKNFRLACQAGNVVEIKNIGDDLTTAIEQFSQQIVDERPRWRLIPFTAGWPFNRAARQFAAIFTIELTIKKTEMQTAVDQVIQSFSNTNSTCLINATLTTLQSSEPNVAKDATSQPTLTSSLTVHDDQQFTVKKSTTREPANVIEDKRRVRFK
ncbi:MAG: hypothetical protein V4501_12980 [Pseudomonadota bacterium]